MNDLQFTEEAVKIRSIILDAKSKMSYVDCELDDFPNASCEVASIILGLLLRTRCKNKMVLAVGKRVGKTPSDVSNHVWLTVDNKLIIDITADQFDDCDLSVIVSERHELHDTFNIYEYREFDRDSLNRPGCHGYDDIYDVIIELYKNT